MLKLYGRRSAFNVQKVGWLIAELELAHEHIELGGSFGGLDDPDFRARNPHGRVPLIDDDGTIVWESHTILRYLAATRGQDMFGPDEPARRSDWERWMDWSLARLQPAFLTGVFWGFYRTPAARRDMATVNAQIDKCTEYMLLLDREIDDKAYLLGDQLSLADIAVGVNFYRYFSIDIPRPGVPNVERWYRTLQQRPAYRDHVMLPFDELYGRLDF
ncbi:MAG: glutathione S-transferase [Hyphomicrobiaceae bacterium]